MKIKLINGHPNIDKSIANSQIIDYLKGYYKENIQIKNLIKEYPDHKIDVEKEQEFLLDADVVIIQFPIYWYSLPAILKQWIDEVWAYGFAYGGVFKLENKHLIASFTIGGAVETYSPISYNKHHIDTYLLHLQQSVEIVKMKYYPVSSFGVEYQFKDALDNLNTIDDIKRRMGYHAFKIKSIIEKIEK